MNALAPASHRATHIEFAGGEFMAIQTGDTPDNGKHQRERGQDVGQGGLGLR